MIPFMQATRLANSASYKRNAMLVLLLSLAFGSAAILAYGWYWSVFLNFLVSEPEKLPERINLVLFIAAVALSAPLVCVGAYLWRLGSREGGAGGILTGVGQAEERAHTSRASFLKSLGAFLMFAAGGFLVILWQLSQLFWQQAP